MWKIRDIEIANQIVVAPMAGVSNGAFRELCYEFGAGLVYAEMLSDKAIFYGNEKTKAMAEFDDGFHPLTAQLFGSDVESMVKAAKFLDDETNCDIIDINMGCPVNKVIKTGAGSALMKNPDLAVEIVRAIVENVKKPVTVKMRLGFSVPEQNFVELAKRLEAVGVSAIALHARTRSEMYEGHAHVEKIKELKDALSIPVIGNGDIRTVEDAINMLKTTGCDAIMIGRGLIGNPFLIKEINNYLEGKEEYHISFEERLKMCMVHTDKLINLMGERNAMQQMRGLAPHYFTGMPSGAKYRGRCNSVNTRADLELIINDYFKFMKENDLQ